MRIFIPGPVKRLLKAVLPPAARSFIRNLPRRQAHTRYVNNIVVPSGNGRCFFLLDTPAHGNLGDQAIAAAEIAFLRDRFPDTPIIEITQDTAICASAGSLKKLIGKEDVILLSGGGNMGTLWEGEDLVRYRVLRLFPNNRVVLFPQSVFFDDTRKGQKALRVSQKKYGKHKCFSMTARDVYSYELMKTYYPQCVIHLAPDIVLYLDRQEPRARRDGALLVLRNDFEKKLSDTAVSDIERLIRSYTGNIRYTDTVLKGVNDILDAARREMLVGALLDEFRKAKLVITDRLHGMVFAAITATPCVVLPNGYHKIKGLYKWVADLPYIRYAETPEDTAVHIGELWRLDACGYDNRELSKHFDVIYSSII